VRTIVESLYLDVRGLAAQVQRRNTTVLLACPPKEQHELGLRMLADRFDLGGYDVVLLGADTPVAEIVAAAAATDASIVALSISTSYERVVFRALVADIRTGLPGVRLVVGGPAFELDEYWAAQDLLDIADLDLPGASEKG
jgi:methylmalonyl-CoA mutase cobalamin-binding subunit